jgi:hypothetical protein
MRDLNYNTITEIDKDVTYYVCYSEALQQLQIYHKTEHAYLLV